MQVSDLATGIAQEHPIGQPDTWRLRWSALEERHNDLIRLLGNSDTSTNLLTEKAEDFFVRCHSLGDHLRSEGVLQASDLEALRVGSSALSICADLANTSKHGTPLTKRARIDPNAKITRIDVTLRVGAGSSHRLHVEAAGKRYDVEDLTRDCLTDWRTSLTSRGLI